MLETGFCNKKSVNFQWCFHICPYIISSIPITARHIPIVTYPSFVISRYFATSSTVSAPDDDKSPARAFKSMAIGIPLTVMPAVKNIPTASNKMHLRKRGQNQTTYYRYGNHHA